MEVGELELNAGNVALDFVNTVEDRLEERPEDLLRAPADLAEWGAMAGVLEGPPQPVRDRGELTRALELREHLTGLLDAKLDGRELAPEDLAALAGAEAAARAAGGLEEDENGLPALALGSRLARKRASHGRRRRLRAPFQPRRRSDRPLRGPGLRLVLPRRDQARQPALVLDAGLRPDRQVGESPGPPRGLSAFLSRPSSRPGESGRLRGSAVRRVRGLRPPLRGSRRRPRRRPPRGPRSACRRRCRGRLP